MGTNGYPSWLLGSQILQNRTRPSWQQYYWCRGHLNLPRTIRPSWMSIVHVQNLRGILVVQSKPCWLCIRTIRKPTPLPPSPAGPHALEVSIPSCCFDAFGTSVVRTLRPVLSTCWLAQRPRERRRSHHPRVILSNTHHQNSMQWWQGSWVDGYLFVLRRIARKCLSSDGKHLSAIDIHGYSRWIFQSAFKTTRILQLKFKKIKFVKVPKWGATV